MAHFAQIDSNNIVTQVIVAEQDVIDTGLFGDPQLWIQTSYNTHEGIHTLNGIPLRKNYAGTGYAYDPNRDAFIPPQPHPSWVLDESTCQWQAPITPPENASNYLWNESTQSWDSIEQE